MNIKGTEADLGDIITHLHEQTSIDAATVRRVLETFFWATADALAESGGRVEYNNFGVFRLEVRAARNGKTPDGVEWSTPERQEIVFHASPETRQTVEDRTGIVTY